MSSQNRAFRDALGNFATGVTVITSNDGQGNPIGMTATSFNSLSLSPPLVLWSIDKSSSQFAAFTQASHFAIHVLNSQQLDLALQFSKKDIDRFEGVLLANETEQEESSETPFLKEFLSRFYCELSNIYDEGDHCIIVGKVLSMECQSGSPLLFFQGQLTSLTDNTVCE